MHSDSTPAPRLLEQVRDLIRIRHYSIRTEQAYLQWIRRYIVYHGRRPPRELGAPELTAFLSDLAIRGKVSASTQNQALNAVLFLYRDVMKITLPWLEDVQRAKRSQHLPVVLSQDKVKRVLAQLRKYPNAAREPGWQYVFPSGKLSADPRSTQVRRHHLLESSVQKAVRRAAITSGIRKRISCHTLRFLRDSPAGSTRMC